MADDRRMATIQLRDENGRLLWDRNLWLSDDEEKILMAALDALRIGEDFGVEEDELSSDDVN